MHLWPFGVVCCKCLSVACMCVHAVVVVGGAGGGTRRLAGNLAFAAPRQQLSTRYLNTIKHFSLISLSALYFIFDMCTLFRAAAHT